jgi:hypothetical protein
MGLVLLVIELLDAIVNLIVVDVAIGVKDFDIINTSL